MPEQPVLSEPQPIPPLAYLIDNPDVISVEPVDLNNNLHFTIESINGYLIQVKMSPFESVVSPGERQRLKLESCYVSDYFIAEKIEFAVGEEKIDLVTVAQGIDAKILVPKKNASVIDASYTQNPETAQKLIEKMMQGEVVSSEEILTILEPRDAFNQDLLKDLSEEEFKYLVRNYRLYGSSSGSRKLATGENYVICPIPISDYGIFVFFHEFGHLIDEDNYAEVINLYEIAGTNINSLQPEERERIINVERRSDAKAAVLFRNFTKVLNASNSKNVKLRQAIQLNLYNYYSQLKPDNVFRAVRKGDKLLDESQLKGIKQFE